MSSYCDAAKNHPYHGPYHDTEYGFPLLDDDLLFERLVLEINQAGLSWLTILKKRAGLRKAFSDFEIAKVAKFAESDRSRLLKDPGIIRNRLKINAIISNAQIILAIQREYRSFHEWIHHHHPRTKLDWVKLFKKTFKFTGGEITGEFLMSIGYLPGAHVKSCPVYQEIIALNPAWANPDARKA